MISLTVSTFSVETKYINRPHSPEAKNKNSCTHPTKDIEEASADDNLQVDHYALPHIRKD